MCPESAIISNERNESTGSVTAKLNGFSYTCERVHSKRLGYLNKKCMKESSKYRFLYNSPPFTEGRSKGKHRKFHFDTCLLKLFSFSQFIFVVPAQRSYKKQTLVASQTCSRPAFPFTYATGLLEQLFKIGTKAQIPKEKQASSFCLGALCSGSWAYCLFKAFDYPFPICLSSQTTSFRVLSMNIYRVHQVIFLQVPKPFATLENQCMWMNADAVVLPVWIVIAKKHFVNVLRNRIHTKFVGHEYSIRTQWLLQNNSNHVFNHFTLLLVRIQHFFQN